MNKTKYTNCSTCGKKVPINNSLAEKIIRKLGRPMCAECRSIVCGEKEVKR